MPLSRGLILPSTLMPAIGRFSPAALIMVIGVLPSIGDRQAGEAEQEIRPPAAAAKVAVGDDRQAAVFLQACTTSRM